MVIKGTDHTCSSRTLLFLTWLGHIWPRIFSRMKPLSSLKLNLLRFHCQQHQNTKDLLKATIMDLIKAYNHFWEPYTISKGLSPKNLVFLTWGMCAQLLLKMCSFFYGTSFFLTPCSSEQIVSCVYMYPLSLRFGGQSLNFNELPKKFKVACLLQK